MTLVDSITLDPLDIKLITELELDARLSYTRIASGLNTGRTTVAARVQRLLDNNIIKIICWADPLVLGYKLVVSLGISTQPGQICDLASKLEACPSVLGVHLCTGRFDIIAWAVFRNNSELTHFLSKELGSESGIMQVDKMLTIREVKASSRLLKNEKESHPLPKNTKEIDDLDILLIRELQMNPRQRPDFMANKFSLYESTIRRRIQRLVDQNIIQIRAVIDPIVLGYDCKAMIRLKCNPAKIRGVAEAVASYNNIQYVSICAGQYDIDTYGVFKNLGDLENFISVELGSISDLVGIETFVIHNVIKTIFQVPA